MFFSLQNKFMIEEQLKNYLQVELRLLTTPCMIIETEKLGPKFIPVVNKLKKIQLNKCGHEKNPISGSECIKAMIKDNRYVIATQDRDLQDWIRNQVGIGLLYLHNIVPILEDPSPATRKFIARKSKKSANVTAFEGEQLKQIKKKEGLIKENKEMKMRRKKKKGGPNPLSCKKKKPKSDNLNSIKNKAIDKTKKQKKVKIPNVKMAEIKQ